MIEIKYPDIIMRVKKEVSLKMKEKNLDIFESFLKKCFQFCCFGILGYMIPKVTLNTFNVKSTVKNLNLTEISSKVQFYIEPQILLGIFIVFLAYIVYLLKSYPRSKEEIIQKFIENLFHYFSFLIFLIFMNLEDEKYNIYIVFSVVLVTFFLCYYKGLTLNKKKEGNLKPLFKSREKKAILLREAMKQNSKAMIMVSGEWGIGKTFFVRNSLEKKRNIININCMLYDDRESLMKVTLKELELYFREKGIITDDFKAFYKYLLFTLNNLPLNFNFFVPKSIDLETHKNNIKILLEKLKDDEKPILVIDNLERILTQDKIKAILGFLHELYEIGNIQTITLCDYDKLTNGVGKDYIDKFFYYNIKLNPISLEENIEYFLSKSNSTLNSSKIYFRIIMFFENINRIENSISVYIEKEKNSIAENKLKELEKYSKSLSEKLNTLKDNISNPRFFEKVIEEYILISSNKNKIPIKVEENKKNELIFWGSLLKKLEILEQNVKDMSDHLNKTLFVIPEALSIENIKDKEFPGKVITAYLINWNDLSELEKKYMSYCIDGIEGDMLTKSKDFIVELNNQNSNSISLHEAFKSFKIAWNYCDLSKEEIIKAYKNFLGKLEEGENIDFREVQDLTILKIDKEVMKRYGKSILKSLISQNAYYNVPNLDFFLFKAYSEEIEEFKNFLKNVENKRLDFLIYKGDASKKVWGCKQEFCLRLHEMFYGVEPLMYRTKYSLALESKVFEELRTFLKSSENLESYFFDSFNNLLNSLESLNKFSPYNFEEDECEICEDTFENLVEEFIKNIKRIKKESLEKKFFKENLKKITEARKKINDEVESIIEELNTLGIDNKKYIEEFIKRLEDKKIKSLIENKVIYIENLLYDDVRAIYFALKKQNIIKEDYDILFLPKYYYQFFKDFERYNIEEIFDLYLKKEVPYYLQESDLDRIFIRFDDLLLRLKDREINPKEVELKKKLNDFYKKNDYREKKLKLKIVDLMQLILNKRLES